MVPSSQDQQLLIQVERQPSGERLQALGVFQWPIWTKEVAEFPWYYDEPEMCYFLEGDVIVMPENGEPVSICKGDLVTFPTGLSCVWLIKKDVKKHYRFG